MAPAMPAGAVIVAGLLARHHPLPACAAHPSRQWQPSLSSRRLGIAAPFDASFLPSAISVNTTFGGAAIPLHGQPMGYEMPPGPGYGTQIITALEDRSRSGTGQIRPEWSRFLESEPVVNGNTLGWIAGFARRSFRHGQCDDLGEPAKPMLKALRAYNFVLYVRQPPLPANSSEDRLALDNSPFQAAYLTPKDFGHYTLRRTLPIGDGQTVEISQPS